MRTTSRGWRGQRRAGVVAVIGALAAVATGCGSSDDGGGGSSDDPSEAAGTSGVCGSEGDSAWQDTLAAAQEEGALEVWSTINQQVMDRVEQDFNDACPGIDANLTAYAQAELTVRIDAEQQSGASTVDAMFSSDRVFHAQRHEQGYWSEITGPWIDSAQDAASENALSGEPPADPGAPRADQILYDDDTRLMTLVGPWGYAWNKGVVEGTPSLEDVYTNDDYRVGILDPGVAPIVTMLYLLVEEQHPDLLTGLAEQEPVVYASAQAMTQGLAAGEVDVALFTTEGATLGSPNVGFSFDEDNPAYGSPVYGEVLESAGHASAAQVFMNWVMSEEGQASIAQGYAAVLPGITTLSISDVVPYDNLTIPADEVQAGLAEINETLGR